MRTLLLLAMAVALAALQPAQATDFNFASIGDFGCWPIGGWRAAEEVTVANQFMKSTASMKPRFILNPGDNFYYCGVQSKNESAWENTYEKVFNDPSTYVPWYNALGNHDYGYPGSATAEMEYKSPNNDRWKMPGRYYYERLVFPGEVNISLVVLDASPCQSAYTGNDPRNYDPCGSVIPGCPGCTFHENVIAQSCATQLAWLKDIVTKIPAGDWKIAMIHAPASDIDNEDLITPLQQTNFDMVLNGHVHLLAHYTMDNIGTYITSGAGCMVHVENRPQTLKHDLKLGASSCTSYSNFHTCQIVWQQTIPGYTTHEFDANFTTLTTKIIDWNGNLLHTVDTKKGGGNVPPGPGPNPNPPGPNPPSPDGSCCYYRDSSCHAGQTCCNDKGKSYDEWTCKGGNGEKHQCKWTDGSCVVA